VPSWFVALLGTPRISDRFPIYLKGERFGDLVFRASMSADISERWLTFVGILTSAVVLAVISSVIAYLTVGATLQPLRGIEAGLTQLRGGAYDVLVPCAGPPEIRKSCQQLNELAVTLSQLSSDNTRLLRRLIVLEEQERRDLSRELHDELGPLLFAIRANSAALLDERGETERDSPPAVKLSQAVETLQRTNRRILDRLRPMHIQELGLQRSIDGLVEDAKLRAPGTAFEARCEIGPAAVDDVVANTIYRTVQEALTNVLKHAHARHARVQVRREPLGIVLSVIDDGIGLPENHALGRGLTGMRERVTALGGTFRLQRTDTETVVSCFVPAQPPTETTVVT
jgi:two-component system sensor histidine kinase UhpB